MGANGVVSYAETAAINAGLVFGDGIKNRTGTYPLKGIAPRNYANEEERRNLATGQQQSSVLSSYEVHDSQPAGALVSLLYRILSTVLLMWGINSPYNIYIHIYTHTHT